ncbi:hypothetical protein F2P56_002043, partial [Juglans regia]
MRVMGKIGGQSITILIDTGSTHNFLDPAVFEKAKLHADCVDKVKVRVASGELLSSVGRCKEVRVKIQGVIFVVDVHVLVLAGCDMVLGMQWLRELGTVLWNFNKLSMKFSKDGKEVSLQGLVATKLIEEGSLSQFNKLESRGVVLQVVEGEEVDSAATKAEVPRDLQELLDQFSEVFQEPKGLPPTRSHDHSIPLVSNAKPISQRPYRYPYFQKDEIERIVEELLSSGVIRPSHSPYSSPVLLLVRKADGTW